MTRVDIINEIKRIAQENGGVPLGWRRFSDETGINLSDLHKNSLARYSDACVQAGFAPNKLTTAYDETELLEKYANLAKELGHLPGKGDLRVKACVDVAFPYDGTFKRALGGKSELIAKLLNYCRNNPNYANVVPMCETYISRSQKVPEDSEHHEGDIGYVYMIKHGGRREYKIGHTNNALRREGEISIELPEKVTPIHVIKTDDPSGIEAYWHKRFEAKRKNGEWFELDAKDVSAFRRRRGFM